MRLLTLVQMKLSEFNIDTARQSEKRYDNFNMLIKANKAERDTDLHEKYIFSRENQQQQKDSDHVTQTMSGL